MNGNRRVVITGIGIAAPNGIGKDAFLKNCRNGISGIRDCTLFPTEKLRTGKFGQVSEESAAPVADWKEESRMQRLMRRAFSELYPDAGYSKEQMEKNGRRACLCIGSLLALPEAVTAYTHSEAANESTTGWLDHAMEFAPWLRNLSGVRGGVYVDAAACASGTTAAGMALDFIRSGIYDTALVGGADALLAVNAYGFHALQALSTGVCSPFDADRDGINIGEGAAFFLVEELSLAKQRGAHIYGELLGYGLNNDAYHITSPDPKGTGAAASMRQALEMGGILPKQVDAVNAHGTGTPVNDPMELSAIEQVFGSEGDRPAVNSTKALIGHCMGASGALEMAAVLLEMQEGCRFPMPNLKLWMEGADSRRISAQGAAAKTQYALSNSLAFAGNTASILLGAYKDE